MEGILALRSALSKVETIIGKKFANNSDILRV